MQDSTIFSSLMEEYGTLDAQAGEKALGARGNTRIANNLDEKARKEVEAALMQAEERNTGAVSWGVYKKYLRFAGGLIWAPIILSLLVLNEGAQGRSKIFSNAVPG